MKRATREFLLRLEAAGNPASPYATDLLDSDAHQHAEIRDLRARLKAAHDCWFIAAPEHVDHWDDALAAATDLKNKKWRTTT